MRVAIPHRLGREKARQRLAAGLQGMAEQLPGATEIETSWTGQDRMDLVIRAMGQTLSGELTIEESEVVISLELPFLMSLAEPAIAGAIREQGQKLLA